MSGLLKSALGETIQVTMQLAANLGKIEIDPAQIESALLALAVNAHEAMPQGGALTIETSTTRLDVGQTSSDLELTPGVYAALAVSDTGVGMPPEAIECAFDPFFTTKGLATHSGLGLSMVHGFVKQSGGFVDVRSEPGDGTTVTLYFPVTEAEEEKEAIAPEAKTELESLPPQRTRFEYTGHVVSGATVGTWAHAPLSPANETQKSAWQVRRWTVDLPYREGLPNREDVRLELARWRDEEENARRLDDLQGARNARAFVERKVRELSRLDQLPAGDTFPYGVTLWRAGDALWIAVGATGDLCRYNPQH